MQRSLERKKSQRIQTRGLTLIPWKPLMLSTSTVPAFNCACTIFKIQLWHKLPLWTYLLKLALHGQRQQFVRVQAFNMYR